MSDAGGAGGLDEIVRIRREKALKLSELGWPSFPSAIAVEHTAAEVRAAGGEVPTEVVAGAPEFRVAGRIHAMRGMGKASFIDLWDRSGKIQVQVKKDVVGEEAYQRLKLLDVGDFLWVRGPRFLTRMGELTLAAQEIRLAAKSLHPIPDSYFGVADVELRYRQRYLDMLANPDVKNTFRKRSEIVRGIRAFLDARGFLEVETPMLHSLITGAAARPFVTHHNTLDVDLVLRIAPELHLKRLVVGGFERVYEINRNFRNEGISVRHNPEFTMLEFYQAYATYQDLMTMTEEMLRRVAEECMGTLAIPRGQGEQAITIDLSKPFRRVGVREGLLEKLPGLNLSDKAAILQAAKEKGIGLDPKAPVGKLVMDLFEHLWADDLVQPTFVVDFPVDVSPLARRKDSDPTLTDRFELYVGGMEVANGFTELNDPDDQRSRFVAQVEAKAAGADEAMDYDEDYCHALEIGMPPTAGEGLGIDRLVMLLTNQASIRDVILFPQMRRLGGSGEGG
ncbi:MAG: lysine--tRNA ligase [Myxococcota bacterium]